MTIERSNTHSFDWQLACIVGVEKAILLGYFQFWISENEKRKSAAHFREGEYWTYTTGSELAQKYPYLKAPSVYRWLQQLEADEWIKTGRFNEKNINQTTWYGRGKRLLEWLKSPIYQNDKSEQTGDSQSDNSDSQNDKSGYQNDNSDSQNDNPIYQNDKANYQNDNPPIYKDTVINSIINSVNNSLSEKTANENGDVVAEEKKGGTPPPAPAPRGDPFLLKGDAERCNVPYSTWFAAYGSGVDSITAMQIWPTLTDEERLKAMQHTPNYIKVTPKRWRKSPFNYLEQKKFLDTDIISREDNPKPEPDAGASEQREIIRTEYRPQKFKRSRSA